MRTVVDNQGLTVIVAKDTYRIEFAKGNSAYILKNGEQRNQIIFRYKVNMQLKDQV
jgi:hypothetical protein